MSNLADHDHVTKQKYFSYHFRYDLISYEEISSY